MYYYNFGRGITPENKHLLINRAKNVAQVLTILWFPLLIHWPSGIQFYIFCNALYSVFQSHTLSSMWFMKRLNPKLMVTHLMLRASQFDQNTSDNMVDSIKKSEESFLKLDVKEKKLVLDSVHALKECQKISPEEAQRRYKDFFGL